MFYKYSTINTHSKPRNNISASERHVYRTEVHDIKIHPFEIIALRFIFKSISRVPSKDQPNFIYIFQNFIEQMMLQRNMT